MVAFVDMSCIIPYAGPTPKATSKPPSKPLLPTPILRPSVHPPRPSFHKLPPRPQFLQPPQPLRQTPSSDLSRLPAVPLQKKNAPSVPAVSVHVREIAQPHDFDKRFAMLDQMNIGSRTVNNPIDNNQRQRYDKTGDAVRGGVSIESFDRKSGYEDESVGLTSASGHPAQFPDGTALLKDPASECSTHVGPADSKLKRVRFSDMDKMGSWKLVEDHNAASNGVTTDATTTMLTSHDVSQLGVLKGMLKKPGNVNGPLGLPLSVSGLTEVAVLDLEDSRDKTGIEGGGSGLVRAEHQSAVHDDRSGSPRNISGNPRSRCHVNDILPTLSSAHVPPVLSGHGRSSTSRLGSKSPSRELPPSPSTSVIKPKPQASCSRSEKPEHDLRTCRQSNKRKSQPQSRGRVDIHGFHDDNDDDDDDDNDNDDDDDKDYIDVDSDGPEDPDALLHPAKRHKSATSPRRTPPTPCRPAREVSPETTASPVERSHQCQTAEVHESETFPVKAFFTREVVNGRVFISLAFEVADASQSSLPHQPAGDETRDNHEHHNTQSTLRSDRKSSKSTTKKRLPFSPEEDRRLVRLKEVDCLPWIEIAKHFPSRSEGSLQVRYSNKLKGSPKGSEEGIMADSTSFKSDRDEEQLRSQGRYGQRRTRRPVDRFSPV